jgi:hypothetical protein
MRTVARPLEIAPDHSDAVVVTRHFGTRPPGDFMRRMSIRIVGCLLAMPSMAKAGPEGRWG